MKRVIIGVGATVAILCAAAVGVALMRGPNHYEATEITMEELPAEIKTQAEAVVDDGGAYFFRPEGNTETSYVLLTFGKQTDLAMDVTVSQMKEGLYFAVAPVETVVGEKAVYRLYETDAPAISSDKNILEKPRLVQGAKGMNVGYLTTSEKGYYILPLEDDSVNDRLYGYEGENKLQNGLYRYTYELTANGPILQSVSAIDSFTKKGFAQSVDEDASSVTLYLVDQESIKYTMAYDSADKDMMHDLKSASELGSECVLSFVFHYDAERKMLKLDKAEVIDEPLTNSAAVEDVAYE